MTPCGCSMGSKINRLLQQWPPGSVATQGWMNSQGVDRRLADKYVKSGWLERLGHGAFKRAGATVDWVGAVHALQTQLGIAVHPGGITAIELRGYTQSIAFGAREVVLFANRGTKLPAWFDTYSWDRPVKLVTTSVFADSAEALSTLAVDHVELEVATLEQAAFGALYVGEDEAAVHACRRACKPPLAKTPRVVEGRLWFRSSHHPCGRAPR